MSGKIRNKKRRLAGLTDISRESTVNEMSHSRVLRSSGKLITFPSHAAVTIEPLTPTISGSFSPEMDSPSEISYSVNTGKKRKSNMPEKASDDSSKIIHCHRPSYDGQLLDAINFDTSHDAMALLTSKNVFSQEGLNQALISACRRGHKQLVQTLIRAGANIEHRDKHGNTPLLICAETGFMDIVQFLVSRHANVNAINSVGNTALILSVRSAGSTDLSRFLVEQQDVDIHHENQNGHTAFIRAVHFMDVDTLRLMLEKSMSNAVQKVADLSSKSQEILEQFVVERTGFRAVYRILQDHLNTGTSPLELAIKDCDTKSFDIFIDCQFSSIEEKKRLIDSALKFVFENNRHKSGDRFSSTDVKIIQKLLQYGADVNPRDRPRPIYVAVESGNVQLVELLCTHGTDLKTYYSREPDLVCIAAQNGHRDIIDLLLKYKADVNTSSFTYSALDCALKNDQFECANLLIQNGAKMNVVCALGSAVQNQKPKYLSFLFKNYSDIVTDVFSRKGTVAMKLLSVAAKEGNCEIIGQILDAGVDVNEADLSGQTPLVMSKNGEVAEFLIQRGADVNREIEKRYGIETALTHMINHREPWAHMINYRELFDASTVELCKVLIDHGAAVNRRSGQGKTPLMMAASKKDCVNLLQLLLDNGANINDSDNKGNSVLMNAVMEQNSKNVTCLIDFATDKRSLINIQNNEGLTPLILSVQKDNVPLVKELIDKGADVNIKDNRENTALHHVLIANSLWSREKILTSLLEAGSHVNCQNSDGLSPLMLATKNTMVSVISSLLDAGADVSAVSNSNASQTALSFLRNFDYRVVLCIEALMNRGANCSYLRYECFHELIIANQITIIPKLIQHGLGPADVATNTTDFQIRMLCCQSSLSPLLVALLHGKVDLARYFVDILFLTSSDMSLFASNKPVVNLLQDKDESLSFLQELCSQPMPLHKLCLVRISTAVGSSVGRETRVDSLPLPQIMKDRLLFKAVAVEHTALAEILSKSNIVTENDSEDDYDYHYDHHSYYESTPSDSSDDSDD